MRTIYEYRSCDFGGWERDPDEIRSAKTPAPAVGKTAHQLCNQILLHPWLIILPVIIVGYGGEQIKDTLGERTAIRGAGGVVGNWSCCAAGGRSLRGQSDLVLVVYGDMPLVRTQTLEKSDPNPGIQFWPAYLVNIVDDNPRGFGRIARNQSGMIQKIVEEVDATPEQLEDQRTQCGDVLFSSGLVVVIAKEIIPFSSGEYYLTDLIELAAKEGHIVGSVQMEDPGELIGINKRVHLAETAQILRGRINQ